MKLPSQIESLVTSPNTKQKGDECDEREMNVTQIPSESERHVNSQNEDQLLSDSDRQNEVLEQLSQLQSVLPVVELCGQLKNGIETIVQQLLSDGDGPAIMMCEKLPSLSERLVIELCGQLPSAGDENIVQELLSDDEGPAARMCEQSPKSSDRLVIELCEQIPSAEGENSLQQLLSDNN